MKTGHTYFLEHFSSEPAAANTTDTRKFGDGLPLSPDQAVFIYNYDTLTLEYARGFGMLGFDDTEITIVEIFNTAIPKHREVCGEISGKALFIAQTNILEPLKNGIVINYAGQSKSGENVHLMLESSIFSIDENGNIITALVKVSRLPHFPIPKIVRWNVFGDFSDRANEFLDETLIHPHRISSRETEVLVKLAEGQTMIKIAGGLFISPRTVEKHILNMKTRFNCANISQLIAYGKDMDLI